MPASFGLERPHLHCTRVHNKGLQTPTSPCARAQSKTCVHQEDTRALACTRQETRASLLHASKRCVRHPLARVQDIRAPLPSVCAPKTCLRHSSLRAPQRWPCPVQRCTRHPLLLATQRCTRLSSYERCNPVLSPPFF